MLSYKSWLGAAQGEYCQRDFEKGKVIVDPMLKDFTGKLEDKFIVQELPFCLFDYKGFIISAN